MAVATVTASFIPTLLLKNHNVQSIPQLMPPELAILTPFALCPPSTHLFLTTSASFAPCFCAYFAHTCFSFSRARQCVVAILPLKTPTEPKKCAPVQIEMSHLSLLALSSSENVLMSSNSPPPPSEESRTASMAYSAAPGWIRTSYSASFDLLVRSSENETSRLIVTFS